MRTHYVPELITICAWMMIGSVTIWLKAQIVTNHHPGTLRSMAGGCLLHICAKLNDTSVASTFGIHEVSGLLASRNVFQNRNKSLAPPALCRGTRRVSSAKVAMLHSRSAALCLLVAAVAGCEDMSLLQFSQMLEPGKCGVFVVCCFGRDKDDVLVLK